MSEERKFWASFAPRMDKIVKVLNSNSENWNPRYDALEDLERLVQSGAKFGGFKKKMMDHQNGLAESLTLQLTDLRSEIVRQAARTINVVAEEMGNSYKRLARKLMNPAIDTAASGNGTIRGYARKVVPCLLQHMHSKGILMCVLNALNDTKSNTIRENCVEYIHTILAFWNPQQELASNQKAVQDAIVFGLKCPTTAARSSAAKCFWSFVGNFPDTREPFLGRLDARARRIVEKGKTLEDEKKETAAATKISAVMKGHVARTRLKRSLSFGKSLSVGDRVRVGTEVGVVKFIGEISGKTGEWVGVEADVSSESYGDGTIGGKRYFDCQASHGIFSRLTDVRPEDGPDQPPNPIRQGTVDDDSDDDSVATPAFQSPRVSEPDSESKLRTPVSSRSAGVPRKVSDSLLTPMEPPSPTFPSEIPEKPTPTKRSSLQASAVQKMIDASPASAAKPKKGTHQRELSVVTTEEKERLIVAARDHLTSMGAAFQKEMDLWELGHEHPDYVSSMIKLMDEVARSASSLKNQLTAIQRHKANEEVMDDEFLQSMDNFAKT